MVIAEKDTYLQREHIVHCAAQRSRNRDFTIESDYYEHISANREIDRERERERERVRDNC